MLDLKKLEDRLDLALEQEDAESLSTWLQKKREKSYYSFLGLGAMEEKKHIVCEYSIDSSPVAEFEAAVEIPISFSHKLAA